MRWGRVVALDDAGEMAGGSMARWVAASLRGSAAAAELAR